MPETPAQPTQPPECRRHGHKFGDAYYLMLYRSDDRSVEEWIWNSRDGITPMFVESRDGRTMSHVEWLRDRYAPSHVPAVGDRIFADVTPERAREFATAKVERWWDDPEMPMSRLFDGGTIGMPYLDRAGAIEYWVKKILADWDGHPPDLIEVTPKMHLAFQKRADSFLLHRTPYVGHN